MGEIRLNPKWPRRQAGTGRERKTTNLCDTGYVEKWACPRACDRACKGDLYPLVPAWHQRAQKRCTGGAI